MPTRGCHVDIPRRRRRGRDADIPWRRRRGRDADLPESRPTKSARLQVRLRRRETAVAGVPRQEPVGLRRAGALEPARRGVGEPSARARRTAPHLRKREQTHRLAPQRDPISLRRGAGAGGGGGRPRRRRRRGRRRGDSRARGARARLRDVVGGPARRRRDPAGLDLHHRSGRGRPRHADSTYVSLALRRRARAVGLPQRVAAVGDVPSPRGCFSDESRRRRGCDVDIRWRQVARRIFRRRVVATPWLRR